MTDRQLILDVNLKFRHIESCRLLLGTFEFQLNDKWSLFMNKQIVLAGILLMLPAYSFAESLTVKTEKAAIRSRPSFISEILANVTHNNSVAVIKKQGAWRMIEFGPHEGWMHVLSLIQPERKFLAGKIIDQRVSSKEISLAGKGFNSDVERAYKKQQGSLGYVWVNNMEKIKVTPAQLEQFASKSEFVITAR